MTGWGDDAYAIALTNKDIGIVAQNGAKQASNAKGGTDYATEADFQNAIIAYARPYGWEVYHTHNSRFSEANFPDLFLLRPAEWDEAKRIVEAVVFECKMPGQKPRPGKKTKSGRQMLSQQEWIDLLNRVPGIRARVVWPKDLEEIKQWLR